MQYRRKKYSDAGGKSGNENKREDDDSPSSDFKNTKGYKT
jgi:hypothetical protein